MTISDFFGTENDEPRRSEFFNAKYSGRCAHDDCYKRNEIEIGDGCEYFDSELMHMRCARAAERAANE